MFTCLRIIYMLVHDDLVDALRSIRILTDSYPFAIAYAALAEFVEDRFLCAHTRRMRALYNARQTVFIEAIRREFDGFLPVNPEDAGMHLRTELRAVVTMPRSHGPQERQTSKHRRFSSFTTVLLSGGGCSWATPDSVNRRLDTMLRRSVGYFGKLEPLKEVRLIQHF